jgi:hypothetical protein
MKIYFLIKMEKYKNRTDKDLKEIKRYIVIEIAINKA